jgi:hypothetical protein
MPKTTTAALLVCLCSLTANADTTINISSTVRRSSVKRLGMNLGETNFFDSPLMKNVLFQNPGLEGEMYQSAVRCASGSATSCTDDNRFSAWPTGFWNGASFEVITGAALGRTGTISQSTTPSGSTGSLFTFSGTGTAPAAGDYLVLRKAPAGGLGSQWRISTGQGGVVAMETADLPPATEGRQAVRLTTTSASQSASIAASTDTFNGLTFLQFNGSFRLSFKARGLSGSNTLNVDLRRLGTTSVFINQNVTVLPTWSTHEIDFTASETGTAVGHVQIRLSALNSSLLLDEISLVQLQTDTTNKTAFRDPVVNALKTLRPGLLRYWSGAQLGDSLDNQIAASFARLRSGYSSAKTQTDDIDYGLHDFLELCDAVQAEPWYVVPVTFSVQEMTNLMEYLGGSSTSTYGKKRAARGRSAPWTDAFTRIHLEFGNESWNSIFDGGAIQFAAPYGTRGSQLFGIAKASPSYSSTRFDLVLGGQHAFVDRNRQIHNASANHDSLALAPYIGAQIDDFSTNEDLFGSLFAEVEIESLSRFMRQNFDMMQATTRPVGLSIYEVNLHTTLGSISQTALDSFTPSLGAGLAVANHMLMMLRELGIRDQMLFALAQYEFFRSDGKTVFLWGATRDLGVKDLRRPQFLALQLANEAIAGDLLQTTHTGDNPTWDQPLRNGVQLNGAHFLQSYAFARGVDRAVVLFNLSRTTSFPVVFTGPNTPRGTVTRRQLTSPNITDTNETSETVRITSQTISSFNAAESQSLPAYSMTVFSWQQGDPVLEITLNKNTYSDGDTLTLTELRPRNPGASSAAVRLELFFTIPGIGRVTLADVGADGTFQLPANLDVNAGPLSLFQVDSSFPRGNWEINSRMTNPATAARISEDLNPFIIR